MLESLRGREARPASVTWNVTKTLMQIVIIWSLFLYVFPMLILRLERGLGLQSLEFASPIWRGIGAALFLLMSGLGLTTGMLMAVQGSGTPLPADCPRKLVIIGPYRWVRNPMALAGIGQGVAVSLYLGSPMVLLYALAGAFVWNYGARPWEERDLEKRFSAPYQAYRDAVKCWIPRLKPYRQPEE